MGGWSQVRILQDTLWVFGSVPEIGNPYLVGFPVTDGLPLLLSRFFELSCNITIAFCDKFLSMKLYNFWHWV